MSATRITIELSPAELKRLDAYVARRNREIVGKPVTRAGEVRRFVIEEIGVVERFPQAFWSDTGGGSGRIDGGG